MPNSYRQPVVSERPIDSFFAARYVPVAGYEWEMGAISIEAPTLPATDVLIVSPKYDGAKRTFPLRDTPDLHLELAGLSNDPASIKTFADTNGWLGIGREFRLINTSRVVGETLEQWAVSIAGLRFAVSLWNAIKVTDEKFLESVILWQGSQAVSCAAVVVQGEISGKIDAAVQNQMSGSEVPSNLPPGIFFTFCIARKNLLQKIEFARWEKAGLVGSYLAPAKLLLAELINDSLRPNCAPMLMIDDRGDLVGHTVPVNLIGVAWLELFQVVTNQLHLRTCIVCGRHMDVTQSRSTKKMHEHCANRRRVKRHLDRKKEGSQDV